MGTLADILRGAIVKSGEAPLSPEENERRRIAFQKFAEQRRKIQHAHLARQRAEREAMKNE